MQNYRKKGRKKKPHKKGRETKLIGVIKPIAFFSPAYLSDNLKDGLPKIVILPWR